MDIERDLPDIKLGAPKRRRITTLDCWKKDTKSIRKLARMPLGYLDEDRYGTARCIMKHGFF